MNNQNFNPGVGYNYRPPKKKNTALIVVICIISALVLLFVFGAVMSSIINGIFSHITDDSVMFEQSTYLPAYDNIAMVNISGTISSVSDGMYNHEWLLGTIKDLTSDTYNKGMCLFINTPGGGVYQTDEIYLALLDYKETGRPIYVYMGEICASGGYYMACAADKIYANRNTFTGSIGVVMNTVVDVSDLLEKLGIKTATVFSGKNKNMGSYFDEFTDEQRAIYQYICDEAYVQFVSIVAEGRDMSVSEVKKLADGRIYTAKQAKANGLIDDVITYEEFIETVTSEISSSVSSDEALPITDYTYYYSYSLFDIFGLGFAAKPVSSEEALIYEILKSSSVRPVYYCSKN